ncbi:MAG: hypothetical protein Q7S96_02115 [bacterium]|nr:hypothetical protein [bacterium]
MVMNLIAAVGGVLLAHRSVHYRKACLREDLLLFDVIACIGLTIAIRYWAGPIPFFYGALTFSALHLGGWINRDTTNDTGAGGT